MLEKLLQNEIVQSVLIALITALIAVLGKIIIAMLNGLKNYIDSKLKNENIKSANQKLFEKISIFVMDCYKSGSDDLKEKIKDGKLTADEKEEWKKNLLENIKSNSGKEIGILKEAGYEIEKTIKSYAEHAFSDIKKKLFNKF